MADLIALLTLYYTCDALVVNKPLSLTPDELGRCMGVYEAVKTEFVDGDLPPPGAAENERIRREAYAAFKAWETDNAGLVTTLRAEAMERVVQKG